MVAARTRPAVGTFVIGPHGMIEEVDDAACALLGYARDELLGLHGSELIPREQRPATAASLDRMRRGELSTREGRMQRKDGTMVTLEVRSRVLPDGRLALTLHRRTA